MADQLIDNSGLITGWCPSVECPPECEATPEYPHRFPDTENCTLYSTISHTIHPYVSGYLISNSWNVLKVMDKYGVTLASYNAASYGLSSDGTLIWDYISTVENGIIKIFIKSNYPGRIRHLVHIDALTGALLFTTEVTETSMYTSYYYTRTSLIGDTAIVPVNSGYIYDDRAMIMFIDMNNGNINKVFIKPSTRENIYLNSNRIINKDTAANMYIYDLDLTTISTVQPSTGTQYTNQGIVRISDSRFIVLWVYVPPELYDTDGNSIKVLDGPFTFGVGFSNTYGHNPTRVLVQGDRFIITSPEASYRGFTGAGVAESYKIDTGEFYETITVPIGGLLNGTNMEVLVVTDVTVVADSYQTMRVCEIIQ